MIKHSQKLLILQSTCSIMAAAYECAHRPVVSIRPFRRTCERKTVKRKW